MTEQIKGQMTIYEFLNQDTWSGKTCQEHSAATEEKTSESSLKKPQKWLKGMPAYLDLRVDRNGLQVAASWEMGGALLGEYTMHSFGEFPNEERGSLLSQILEDRPHQKYSLSARACQGILRRAEKRGKKLPKMLEMALLKQSASLSEPDVMGGVKEFLSKTSEQQPCQPSTISQSSECKDNAEHHTICMEVFHCTSQEEMAQTIKARDYKDPQCVAYGIDRASFNQGQNAQFSFSVEEELAQTIVAKGPGGGCNEAVGALCARDYKGVGSQYVDEGKCIIQAVCSDRKPSG